MSAVKSSGRPAASPGYISDPQVPYLSAVLGEVKQGNILIPRFQRKFVWKQEPQLELLRSIREGIPIGSFLVWRTTAVTLRTFPRLGGHQVPSFPEPPPGAPRQYLLDGHQRLSTLFRALQPPSVEAPPPKNENDDPQELLNFFFDLRAEDFCCESRAQDQILMPTNILFDSIALINFQRKLLDRKAPGDGLTQEECVLRADRLANTFRNYKIPIIPLVTDKLEDATKAFQRINSSGTSMSDFHMVAALTYTEQFDFTERTESAMLRLKDLGWGGLDEKYILATIRAHEGLLIVTPDADATSKAITKNPSLLDESVGNLCRAARFLKKYCGVPSPQLLPYSYQAVLLAEAFKDVPAPDKEICNRLANWFWRTTYSAYFLGARDKAVNDALKVVREIARGGGKGAEQALSGDRVDSLPKRYDFRSARGKAFLLLLARLKPLTPAGEPFDATKLLGVSEADVAFQLLTGAQPTAMDSKSTENRFMVDPEQAGEFRDALLSGGRSLSAAFFESHAIPAKAMEALRRADFGAFLRLRREHLLELEMEFVEKLGLKYLMVA